MIIGLGFRSATLYKFAISNHSLLTYVRGLGTGNKVLAKHGIQSMDNQSKSGFVPAISNTAWSYIQSNDLENAKNILYHSEEPRSYLWYQLGWQYWISDDVPNAQDAWEQYIRMQPRKLYDLLWNVQMQSFGPIGSLRSILAYLAPIAVEMDPQYQFAYLLAGDMIVDQIPIKQRYGLFWLNRNSQTAQTQLPAWPD